MLWTGFHQRVCNFLIVVLRLSVKFIRSSAMACLVEWHKGRLLVGVQEVLAALAKQRLVLNDSALLAVLDDTVLNETRLEL